MIQDIAPHTYHNEYKPSAPDKNSFICRTTKKEGSILLPHQEREADIYFPRFSGSGGKKFQISTASIFICFLSRSAFLSDPGIGGIPPFFQITNSRIYRNLQTASAASGICRSYRTSAFQWYSKRRFCGCCGKPMLHSQKERMMECPSCGNQEYPVLYPAVIVGRGGGQKYPDPPCH